eukprot:gb/GFBE01017383.1/.p1 GENE.gb/GFBE01017383.1/~~gb/GFBE01017383.1/.p1  ORF type:complete len:364 (+),score=48.75 gb/GFBE01017383.1/:1-1092(+)
MDGEVRLSKGQKKKLKQRRKNESESRQSDSAIQPTTRHAAGLREPGESVCPTSSEGTPSEFSSSESPSDAEQRDEASPASMKTLHGWPSPKGHQPPGWPPEGAELLSEHPYSGLPGLRRRSLRLAALPCPQPKDKLQWRILPLVRSALGLAGEELGTAEILRSVRGNLPPECVATISATRLSSLVGLVLSRSVRKGRLKQMGKRYALPPVEDPILLVPNICGLDPRVIWVAWCTETKLPREVAMQFACSGDVQLQPSPLMSSSALQAGEILWLIARLPRADRGDEVEWCPPSSEEVDINGNKVWILQDAGSHDSTPGKTVVLWRDKVGGSVWSLLTPNSVSLGFALELAGQCLQQVVTQRRVD